MKILLVDQFSGGAGGQRCLLDLAPGLLERGWDVRAAIPAGGTLGEQLSNAGVRVVEFRPLDYRNGRKSAWDVWRFAFDTPALARLIRQERADVVYANGPRVLPAAALGAKRLVFHAHSLVPERAARILAGLSVRSRNAAVIAACRFVAGPLPQRNLRVVYSGVPDYRGATRPTGVPRIGLIGRISKEKGHLDFLRAARIVLESTACEFVICGAPLHSDRAYVDEVGKLAKQLPVTFLGWRQDVGAVLRGLTVLVVPSSGIDAAPRIVMEAFSAGVPVVAYPSGGIVELIEHEQNGLLTSSPQPAALAASLLDLIADPAKRRRLADCGRATYIERFTVERYRREVLEILEGF